jgi:hypothetical protein
MKIAVGPKRQLRDVCYSAASRGKPDIARTGHDFRVSPVADLSTASKKHVTLASRPDQDAPRGKQPVRATLKVALCSIFN